MKTFFKTLFLAVFIAIILANSSAKPTLGNDSKKAHCSVNNYVYARTSNKEIEQHFEEIKNEIRTLKGNQTSCPGSNGLSSEVKQQLAEIKQEIIALKENQTNVLDGSALCSEVKQMLTEIKQEIRALKENQTESSSGKVYKNCAEAYKSGKRISGVYKIDPDGLGGFEVFCDHNTTGGGWTVFQKRGDGSVDFYRGWADYKRGFGNLNGEFWLGLDKIHRLTVSSRNKLRVDLGDVQGNTPFAEYSSFVVASERANYQMSLGSYSGTAGDSLGFHRGLPFTTKDRDNDRYSGNCALLKKGAWWYGSCYDSNLNGLYQPGKTSNDFGMVWNHWKNKYFVRESEMKIRPTSF